MRTLVVLMVVACVPMPAEVRTMTLREAIALALDQNPDVLLARLDEQKALQSVRVARDPFMPKVSVGSGLAYSNGFPMTIEGAGPSIVQARAVASIFDRPQSYQVAKAREEARGAAIDVAARREEVAFQTASLFLDASRAAQTVVAARHQVADIEKVAEIVQDRVKEGRELVIESKRAELDLARARARSELLESQQMDAETSLGVVLGLGIKTQVRPADGELPDFQLPPNQEQAVEGALDSNREIKKMQSDLLAKSLDIRSQRATRWPKVDLLAQYAMFAEFNNYQDYFRTFQRHNGEVGISVQLPVLTGSAPRALAASAETEAATLRVRIQALRNKIALDVQKSFRDVKQAETAVEVARLDLELARDQTAVVLAQTAEDRASVRQVEEARFTESEKWIAYYESRFSLERSRLNLLKQTGTLLAHLR